MSQLTEDLVMGKLVWGMQFSIHSGVSTYHRFIKRGNKNFWPCRLLLCEVRHTTSSVRLKWTGGHNMFGRNAMQEVKSSASLTQRIDN